MLPPLLCNGIVRDRFHVGLEVVADVFEGSKQQSVPVVDAVVLHVRAVHGGDDLGPNVVVETPVFSMTTRLEVDDLTKAFHARQSSAKRDASTAGDAMHLGESLSIFTSEPDD